MTRAPRPDPIDGWHHVMNRGVDRMAIFRDDSDRTYFEHLVGVACARYGIVVHAYCLMTNHFHLLVHCPDGALSQLLHDLTGTYARHFNHRHGRVGHLFGDRFTSRLVTSDAYILSAVRYIHRNPLAIVGVDDCADHRWSSHRAYLGQREAPPWLAIERVSGWFDNTTAFASHVSDDRNPNSVANVSAPEVVSTIELVVAERSTLGGRALMGQRKAIAFGVADALDAPSIAEHFDFSNDAALRTARWRARRRLAQRPDDRHFVDRVVDLVPMHVPGAAVAA